MKLDIRALGFPLTEGLRACVESGLHHALRERRGDIRRVQVRLVDVNGPRGGEDKRCAVRAWLHGGRPLLVARAHHDLYTAIDEVMGTLRHHRDRRSGRARALHRGGGS